jgi:adenylate kinase family enzyme
VQRIWVTGPAGSGKTTVALLIGKSLGIPVFHRDAISWGEEWAVRTDEQQSAIIKEFTCRPAWIYDGNRFTASMTDGRFENCDTIIDLHVSRLICLYRTFVRFLRHRNTPRKELSRNCPEEFDFNVIKGILFDYPRKRPQREILFHTARQAGKTVLNFRRSQIRRWCAELVKQCR